MTDLRKIAEQLMSYPRSVVAAGKVRPLAADYLRALDVVEAAENLDRSQETWDDLNEALTAFRKQRS